MKICNKSNHFYGYTGGHTGCVKSTGTTFGASTEAHSGLTKIFFYAKTKIFDKSLHYRKTYFLRNRF